MKLNMRSKKLQAQYNILQQQIPITFYTNNNEISFSQETAFKLNFQI